MTVSILPADVIKVRKLISDSKPGGLTLEEKRALDISLAITSRVWIGMYDDKVACAWGLMPPTLLSNNAHLWLFTTDDLIGHEFFLVRYSQRVIEILLDEYDTIIGTADPARPSTIRWLKWLGATFDHPIGRYVPFVIRKK